MSTHVWFDLGEALSELIQSMSEFYNSSSLTMSSLDQDSDNYAVAKLNDKHWQRYTLHTIITKYKSEELIFQSGSVASHSKWRTLAGSYKVK